MAHSTSIFYDGAEIAKHYDRVSGFTTNTSILRAHGVSSMRDYAREAVLAAQDKPISLQLLDIANIPDAVAWAREMGQLGTNVFIKVPIVNGEGELTTGLLEALQREGVQLNVTAVFTKRHVDAIRQLSLARGEAPAIVSIFAGKISDSGEDPTDLIHYAKSTLPACKILWAGCRSVSDHCRAIAAGVDIVTVPETVLDRLCCLGQPLELLAATTVNKFLLDGAHLARQQKESE